MPRRVTHDAERGCTVKEKYSLPPLHIRVLYVWIDVEPLRSRVPPTRVELFNFSKESKQLRFYCFLLLPHCEIYERIWHDKHKKRKHWRGKMLESSCLLWLLFFSSYFFFASFFSLFIQQRSCVWNITFIHSFVLYVCRCVGCVMHLKFNWLMKWCQWKKERKEKCVLNGM